MRKSYLHMIDHAHSLSEFRGNPDPEILVRRLRVASHGEAVAIRAALSLVPKSWLPEVAREVEFRLSDIYLDAGNTRALLEAIALEADHPEVLGNAHY